MFGYKSIVAFDEYRYVKYVVFFDISLAEIISGCGNSGLFTRETCRHRKTSRHPGIACDEDLM